MAESPPRSPLALFFESQHTSASGTTNAYSQPDLDQIQLPPSKRIRFDEDDIDTTIHDRAPIPSPYDSPGNPMRPETFFDCLAEKKLAAYLGFDSMPELHICAISWPFLRAMVAIQPIIHTLNRDLALTLIRDAPRLGDSAAIDQDWSLLTSDGKGLSNPRKAEHLAIVLVNLKSDLATMTAASDKQNQLQHQHECQKLNTTYPTHICPQISYPVRSPILSPLEGEHFLEPYNRCFLLLRHLRNILNTKVFDTRYKNDNFKSGHPVKDENKPTWMRPTIPSMTPVAPKRGSHVTAASSANLSMPIHLAAPLNFSTVRSVEMRPHLPLTARSTLPNVTPSPEKPTGSIAPTPRSFSIVWDHDLETEYMRSEIKRAMSHARSKDIDPPSELQKLRKDPRQMIEEPLLYEQIRVQFRCHFLGIDLSKLLLQYTTSAFGDSVTVKQNLQDESWCDTQAALSDPANDNFLFRVGFLAIKYEEDESEVY